MKICVISTSALPAPVPNRDYGGLENIAYDSAAAMAKMENEVTLITTDESQELGFHPAVDDKGDQKGFLNVISAGQTAWDAFGERNMFFRYHDWLEKEFGEGQGVVISHGWFGYPYLSLIGYPALNVAPHPKMKLMHVIHGVTGWQSRPNTPFPRILGVSKGHAQYLSNHFKIPVRHVFNGIHLPDRPTDWVKGDYLLSLNRISREKGIHNSIDVALATGNKIKVVGDDTKVQDPQYVWQIMNQCESSQGMAEYIGPVSNDDKWDLIRNCKALITCPDSSTYVESFYLGAIEGFAMGKPILALRNGGLNDTVMPGTNGFLFDTTGDMKSLIKMEAPGFHDQTPLDIVCAHPDAIRSTAEQYTVERMAEGYLDLCKGVFNNDPAYVW